MATTTRTDSHTEQQDHELVGMQLGIIERRYGMMTSTDAIAVAEVIGVSGDLAVADRIAFIASMERRTTITVVAHEGWYAACITDRPIATSELLALRMPVGAPRIMSLATDRGIRPTMGPLVA